MPCGVQTNKTNRLKTVSQNQEAARKIFILDSNILLVDPSVIDSFDDDFVVVSLTVMEELDALKTRSNTEYEARRAINAIVELTKPLNLQRELALQVAFDTEKKIVAITGQAQARRY